MESTPIICSIRNNVNAKYIMNRPFEYFYNRIFYQLVVFFQMRWLVAFFLKFEKTRTFLLKKKNIKKIDRTTVSRFFSPNDYGMTLRGFELFFGIGFFPVGMFFSKGILSAPVMIIIVVIVSVVPIVVLYYFFLLKDNQVVKYYNIFERDSLKCKKKWKFISAFTILVLTGVFAFNWILFLGVLYK